MSSLDSKLRLQLNELDEERLRRSLRVLPDNVLDLASNDYLGLAHDSTVQAAALAAVEHFGTGARASRLVSGHTRLHAELEAALAAFKHTEAALVFPSGYAANIGVINALARPGDFVLCDGRNHASLIDACRLTQATGSTVRYYKNFDKLRSRLQRTAGSKLFRRIIVTDAVYSMDGDLADLPQLVELALEYDAILIVDDAHGTGTLGERGSGTIEHFWPSLNLPDELALIQVGTLSKALGSQGGFVAASSAVIDWLIGNARPFVYTTGLNPAAVGAALGALQVLQREPQRLARLRTVKQKLVQELAELGYNVTEQPSPIIPVVIGEAAEAVRLSDELLKRGLWCPAIRPPTVPMGASRLRVTAAATLTDSEIDTIIQAFADLRRA